MGPPERVAGAPPAGDGVCPTRRDRRLCSIHRRNRCGRQRRLLRRMCLPPRRSVPLRTVWGFRRRVGVVRTALAMAMAAWPRRRMSATRRGNGKEASLRPSLARHIWTPIWKTCRRYTARYSRLPCKRRRTPRRAPTRMSSEETAARVDIEVGMRRTCAQRCYSSRRGRLARSAMGQTRLRRGRPHFTVLALPCAALAGTAVGDRPAARWTASAERGCARLAAARWVGGSAGSFGSIAPGTRLILLAREVRAF